MNDNDVTATAVIAVLLADGWHRIVPGSFRVGPLGFGDGADPGLAGFRFEEADAGRPYRPTLLAGPLHSIIAVRQVTSAVRRIGDADRARTAPSGQGARLHVHTGRAAAQRYG
jgi:hypothetical protein